MVYIHAYARGDCSPLPVWLHGRRKARLQSARGSLGLDLVEVGVIRVDLGLGLGRERLERRLRYLELW